MLPLSHPRLDRYRRSTNDLQDRLVTVSPPRHITVSTAMGRLRAGYRRLRNLLARVPFDLNELHVECKTVLGSVVH